MTPTEAVLDGTPGPYTKRILLEPSLSSARKVNVWPHGRNGGELQTSRHSTMKTRFGAVPSVLYAIALPGPVPMSSHQGAMITEGKNVNAWGIPPLNLCGEPSSKSRYPDRVTVTLRRTAPKNSK